MDNMERLTFVDEKGRVLFSPEGCGEDEGYTIIQLAESGYIGLLEEIAERFANYEQRLKEYEDIDLTPEQLREIDKLYAEKCKELTELEKKSFSAIEMVKIWAKLKKLKEYQSLEEQGKLLKLPCAVGDKVYAIMVDENNFEHFHCRTKISELQFDYWMLPVFGKSIFLTREGAEAALKRGGI